MILEINFSFFKVLGIILLILFLFFILFLLYQRIQRWLRGRDLDLNKDEVKKRWKEIEDLLQKNNEMSGKLAVMEADKLLDYVLKGMYFPGSTMGERLKVACGKYIKLKQVWWPHKIRNQLVHEASFNLPLAVARKTVNGFKNALKELGAI